MSDCPHCARLQRQVTELRDELAAWNAQGVLDEGVAPDRLAVWQWKQALGCTAGEAAVLFVLMAKPGEVVPGEALALRARALNVRAEGGEIEDPVRLVRVQLHRLRTRLAGLGFGGAVETAWGLGYRIKPAEAEQIRAKIQARVQ